MIPLPVIDTRDVLDSITIPVACPVSWDEMHGDHRTRFCDKCSQNVHDVSEMTAAEAVQLVTSGETMPCLRLFRRPDGRVMTTDCLTKRERAWKWLNRRSAWAAAVFAIIFLGCARPGEKIMGDICPPERPATAQGAAAKHDGEHTRNANRGADHAVSPSRMNAEERAAAPARHEAEATR